MLRSAEDHCRAEQHLYYKELQELVKTVKSLTFTNLAHLHVYFHKKTSVEETKCSVEREKARCVKHFFNVLNKLS